MSLTLEDLKEQQRQLDEQIKKAREQHETNLGQAAVKFKGDEVTPADIIAGLVMLEMEGAEAMRKDAYAKAENFLPKRKRARKKAAASQPVQRPPSAEHKPSNE
ncbi:hypothetical protein ACTU44_21825 (plasmid) [Thalassospira sp. SM2505]